MQIKCDTILSTLRAAFLSLAYSGVSYYNGSLRSELSCWECMSFVIQIAAEDG